MTNLRMKDVAPDFVGRGYLLGTYDLSYGSETAGPPQSNEGRGSAKLDQRLLQILFGSSCSVCVE
jgi:hypothetical protein